uniref:Uncharacterized protein n=1 Tax=Kalanchoe fedtschenkoi TaxID=63787 RepID=A0A7N0VCE6_KALFE
MVFGESVLTLKHPESGVKIHFSAMDGWKLEVLSPVEFPAASKWKFRSKPVKEIILDYDYTFTTPYCGSETVETTAEGMIETSDGSCSVQWEDCKEKIDVISLASLTHLFYDELVSSLAFLA